MDNQDENFILVGSLGRTIGLKGKIKLNSYTRPSENIKSYNKFFYKIDGTFKELKTQEISFSGKNLAISFENIKSIEEAENLKNNEIFIKRDDLPKLENQFYWEELIGLRVESKKKIFGKVDSLMETGSNDVLVVHDQNSKEILIPFILEEVIKEVTPEYILVEWEE